MLAHALHGYSLGLQPELVHTFEAGVELTVVAPLVHGSKPGYDYMAAEEEASEDMAAEEEASEDMAAGLRMRHRKCLHLIWKVGHLRWWLVLI